MGMISSRINGLIKDARLAFDDVRRNFEENFGPNHELAKVPSGWFRGGIAVITPNEVCDRHGTGVILARTFSGMPNILSIRSSDLHGEHQFGDYAIRFSHAGLSRTGSYEKLLWSLQGNSFRYAVCVPYYPDELITAIVLKEAFGSKLCIYLMDDNHLVSGAIPEALMRETLEKADLRLAISPEMRDAYESKFRLKFWLRPPVVTTEAVSAEPQTPSDEILHERRGIVVGSLWSNQTLERMSETVHQAGIEVDWFGNADACWLSCDINELAGKGVRARGFVEESRLAQEVKNYAFALVPSGTLEAGDARAEIARYSLPTRIPFLLAAGNIPILVLGSPETASAAFVERFQIGTVIAYDGQKLRRAVEKICSPAAQQVFRETAAKLAPAFSAQGVGRWILDSMELGRPVSEAMETLMPRKTGTGGSIIFLETPAPPDVFRDFVPLYHALDRVRRNGFEPDFVCDVGASTGIWSRTVRKIFPGARFLLFEPLFPIYAKRYSYLEEVAAPGELLPVALGAFSGQTELSVSPDLYGSSLLSSQGGYGYQSLKVPIATLDSVGEERKVVGRGILKLDVQGAEHLVLAGAKHILEQIDVLIAELSLSQLAEGAKDFEEMYRLIAGLGFEYFDDVGEWRCPVSGRLLQKDVLFIRQNLFKDSENAPSRIGESP